MKIKRHLLAIAVAVLGVAFASTSAKAQVSLSVQIGPQPVCPYGYFDYAPYRCAPFGYYGPTWFSNGIFLGAGPWFRGPVGFRGYIDRRFDPRFGYHGAFPRRGARADWDRHRDWERNWHGSEMREEHRHDNGRHYGERNDYGHPREDHGRPNPHDNHGHPNPHGDHGHGNGHN